MKPFLLLILLISYVRVEANGKEQLPLETCRMMNGYDNIAVKHLMNHNKNIRCTRNRAIDAEGGFVLPLMSTIRQQMLSPSSVKKVQDLVASGDSFPNRTLHRFDNPRDIDHTSVWWTYVLRRTDIPTVYDEIKAGYQKAFGADKVVFADYLNLFVVPTFKRTKTRYYVHNDGPIHEMCLNQLFTHEGLTSEDFEETSYVTNVIGISAPQDHNGPILGIELFNEVDGDVKPYEHWEAPDERAPFVYGYKHGETLFFNALRYHRGYITPDYEFLSDSSVVRSEFVVFGARRKGTNTWYIMPMCRKTTDDNYDKLMPDVQHTGAEKYSLDTVIDPPSMAEVEL